MHFEYFFFQLKERREFMAMVKCCQKFVSPCQGSSSGAPNAMNPSYWITPGDLMRFDTGGNRNTLCPKCRSEGRNVPMHHSKGKGSDENGHT
jgi:hypothetical protein